MRRVWRAPPYTSLDMRIHLRFPILLLVLAVFAAACSSSDAEETTTTETTTSTTSTTPPTTTSTTSTTTSTTTTTLAPGIAPTINGLDAVDDLAERRVIGVKVDNHPAARPQTGINEADVVYEILVEGGLTRFIALFHQSDSSIVGPVRSLRPTDIEIMTPLAGPLQISGAAEWVYAYAAKSDVELLRDDGTTTQRDSARSAPHNLYGDTTRMRDRSDQKGWPDEPPPALFTYGLDDLTPTTGSAEHIELSFSDHPSSTWDWDGEKYLHSYGDDVHESSDVADVTSQVEADYVVVILGDVYIARPPNPGDGKAVPATHTIGSGEALVFRNGGVLEALWSRDVIEDPIRLETADGGDVILPPGRFWVEIFPDDRPVTWE